MITVRTDVTDEDRDHELRRNHVPGERVRVNRRALLPGETRKEAEARCDALGDGELTIEEFIFDGDRTLKYRFAGVEGEHDVAAFRDVEELKHCYGVLIGMDGEVWLVPVKSRSDPDEATLDGTPMQVETTLDRLASYWVGPYSGDDLMAEVTGEPWAGEFVFTDGDGGPCRLKGSPWHSSTSDAEARVARTAVEDHLDMLAMSARSLH